jgi:hypothetical protein
MEANKDEITALRIFYNQTYQRREVTFRMIKEVLDKTETEKALFRPLQDMAGLRAAGKGERKFSEKRIHRPGFPHPQNNRRRSHWSSVK